MIKLLEETRDFGDGRKATVVLTFADAPGWKPVLLAFAKRWHVDGSTSPWCAEGAAIAQLPEGALPSTSETMASAVRRIEDLFQEISKSASGDVLGRLRRNLGAPMPEQVVVTPVGPDDSLALHIPYTCSQCGRTGTRQISWVTVYLIGANNPGAGKSIPPGWSASSDEDVLYVDLNCPNIACRREQRVWFVPVDAREKLRQATIRHFITPEMLRPHVEQLVKSRGMKSGRFYYLTPENAAGILRKSTADLMRDIPSNPKTKSMYLGADPEAIAVKSNKRWMVRFRLTEPAKKKGRGK